MPKNGGLDINLFLNRLALDEFADPYAIDPVEVLRRMFRFAEPNEMQDLFNNFCHAAMSDTYCWKEGSPGNLLFFSEKLEQLIEAGYLMQSAKKKRRKKLKNRMRSIRVAHLPIDLTEREFAEPMLVFDRFFSYNSLAQWKLALHNWTMAALANHSISESVEPFTIVPFVKHMEKLISAAYWVMTLSQ